jgi:hypothetical protein
MYLLFEKFKVLQWCLDNLTFSLTIIRGFFDFYNNYWMEVVFCNNQRSYLIQGMLGKEWVLNEMLDL